MATLREIEIFYPGTWNDLTFTDDEMVEMVNNSNRCRPYFQAMLSLNHDEVTPEVIREAAFGVASRFYVKLANGIKHVFADFEKVPKDLAQLIKQFYPRRSIDLYTLFELPTGEVLRNVIAGVSFLGAKMPPAVKGMFPDFVLSYQEPPSQGNIITITLTPMETAMPKKKETFQNDPQAAPTSPVPAVDTPVITPATNEFGLYIATRRAELGLAEADVAERTNSAGDLKVSEQTVKDLEAGIIAPTTLLMDQLANALEIDSETLRGLMTYPSDITQTGFSEESLRRVIAEELRKLGFQENESLGAYLRRIREEKDLSLDDLAIAMEVSTEEIAAIEDAEIPSDELLAKYAEVLELDLDDLKARRDAMEEANQEQEDEVTGEGSSEPAAEFRQIITQMLRPLQREISSLKQDRNTERDRRKNQEVEHFLEKLETHYHASKAVTGPRVRNLLLKLDATRKFSFAHGAKPQSPRECLMDILETIARLGDNIKVPLDRITNEHGKKTFADDTQEFTARVEAFQKERGIKTYQRAVRLYLKEQES